MLNCLRSKKHETPGSESEDSERFEWVYFNFLKILFICSDCDEIANPAKLEEMKEAVLNQ